MESMSPIQLDMIKKPDILPVGYVVEISEPGNIRTMDEVFGHDDAHWQRVIQAAQKKSPHTTEITVTPEQEIDDNDPAVRWMKAVRESNILKFLNRIATLSTVFAPVSGLLRQQENPQPPGEKDQLFMPIIASDHQDRHVITPTSIPSPTLPVTTTPSPLPTETPTPTPESTPIPGEPSVTFIESIPISDAVSDPTGARITDDGSIVTITSRAELHQGETDLARKNPNGSIDHRTLGKTNEATGFDIIGDTGGFSDDNQRAIFITGVQEGIPDDTSAIKIPIDKTMLQDVEDMCFAGNKDTVILVGANKLQVQASDADDGDDIAEDTAEKDTSLVEASALPQKQGIILIGAVDATTKKFIDKGRIDVSAVEQNPQGVSYFVGKDGKEYAVIAGTRSGQAHVIDLSNMQSGTIVPAIVAESWTLSQTNQKGVEGIHIRPTGNGTADISVAVDPKLDSSDGKVDRYQITSPLLP